jgi:hypothetical protein
MARVWRTSPRFGPSSVARSFFVLTGSLFADRSSGTTGGTRNRTEPVDERPRQTEKRAERPLENGNALSTRIATLGQPAPSRIAAASIFH